MMDLDYFKNPDNFYYGLQSLFNSLNVPVNYIDEKPLKPQDVLSKTYKERNPAYLLMDDVYILGMVDDAAFGKKESDDISEIRKSVKDYDGILIFGVTLKKRENGLLPTRTQFAEITRAFNREFHYTPVVVVFRYGDFIADFITLANAERLKYKQEWREGEKAGKVSLLRDIEIENPHTGHLKILQELTISRTGKDSVDSFTKLYTYWQSVFNVSILNKQFYKELSDWYFWAMRKVFFPAVSLESDSQGLFQEEDKVREHNAKNLIRLLTRILFVWFIKEKKLIPEELFDENYIKNELLIKIDPEKRNGFNNKTQDSMYYRAILQNLFFAVLNQDMGKREFRKDDQHMNVTNLMRYKSYFINPDNFIELVEGVVPFMNGGLFECLDKPHTELKGKRGGDVIIYVDGFSDRPDNELKVPDYIFFGTEEQIDLSVDYGQGKSNNKDVSVKGLIDILNSYKFTIDENTPIEEDVALDPELLGKVFENLLASYNPETRSTARNQTGSFYTPREIVNYMVDESLIYHLKNDLQNIITDGNELDRKLHQLLSYDDIQPFEDYKTKEIIIESLDKCKILDPACGSGAFPMGSLQKMVHIIHKIDPENEKWKERQISKAALIDDAVIRDNLVADIEEAFNNNELDYGRKLYLIENCIYGVDIQPIAVQISKLRFFISLIVDQKVDATKDNLGIRPLPNLETKFVAANTLVKLDKPESTLFGCDEVQVLQNRLKDIRHRLFSAKTQATKRKLREEDTCLREKISETLARNGWRNETARQLAKWDPYDQNFSSSFFDPEWLFNVAGGFDIAIGNPPYIQIQKFSGKQEQKEWAAQNYKTFVKTGDIYSLFYEKGNMLLKEGGILAYITSNKWMRANYGKATRKYFLENVSIQQIIDFGDSPIFENATTYTNIMIFRKGQTEGYGQVWNLSKEYKSDTSLVNMLQDNVSCESILNEGSFVIIPAKQASIKKRIEEIGTPLKEWDVSINYGIKTGYNEAFIINGAKKDELIAKDPRSAEIIKPILRGRDIKRYKAEFADLWLVNSHNGYLDNDTQRRIAPIKVNDFPAIKEHLDNYWEKIEKRQDKGVTPYNLRNCAYLKEFEKEKIVYAEIVFDSAFLFDSNGNYPEATVFIMTGKDLRYLTALLNSKLVTYAFKTFYAGGDLRGNTFRYKKVFLNNLPIPKISKEKQLPFEILVDCILFAKENNLEMESQTLESVIDGMVYDVYFEEDMKKADCYITDRITEVVKPFKEDDSDEFKTEYVKKLYRFCKDDKTVFHGLIHRRNIKVVKIINGADK